MRRLVILIGITLLMVGCDLSMMSNTPTKQVEILFNKYQTLDDDVLEDLNNTVMNEENFTGDQQTTYRNLMKKHYQNLQYRIKDETINGNKATVTVEIEVTDYSSEISASNHYLQRNPEEFNTSEGEYDSSKFIDYQLEQLKDVKRKVKYTLDIGLTKVDDKWKLDSLTPDDHDKINGMYLY